MKMCSLHSNGLQSHRISIQWIHFWMRCQREICIMDGQPINLQKFCYHVSKDQNPRDVSSTLLNQCKDQLHCSECRRGSNPILARIYLYILCSRGVTIWNLYQRWKQNGQIQRKLNKRHFNDNTEELAASFPLACSGTFTCPLLGSSNPIPIDWWEIHLK